MRPYKAIGGTIILLLGAAVIATWLRYNSLNPCDWIEADEVANSGLPALVVRTEMRARFLLEGVTDPGPGDCLPEWWRLRAANAPEQ